MAIVAILVGGCASCPWDTCWKKTEDKAPPAAASDAAATDPSPATSKSPDSEALQQVVAEVERLGTIDPAAQKELLADLKQTPPSLWPMLLQQVQAENAYRKKTEPSSKPALASKPLRAADPAGANLLRSPPAGEKPGPAETIAAPPTVAPAVAESSPPQSKLPEAKAAVPVPEQKPPAAPTVQVVQTSYNAPAAVDWQTHLGEAIRQLESQRKGTLGGDAEIAREAYLRTLFLLAGRRDDALTPIPGASPAQQEFWSKELYAMQTWLDTDHNPDGPRRAAETKRILGEAMLRLGETAPLVVHNLAFCSEVQGFGSITPFRKAEFSPSQEVLLYAEVENFAVEPTPRGFHTSLRSSFQIFDSRGQRVADEELATSEDYCQSPRRDFFFGYRLRLPKQICNGKHTLQLTTEDLKSHKVGQSSIELVIKGGED